MVTRRQRTRNLIELGGLVVKAGLVELTGDDRAVLLGAFLQAADMLQGEVRGDALALWRRRGMRAFTREDERPPARDIVHSLASESCGERN